MILRLECTSLAKQEHLADTLRKTTDYHVHCVVDRDVYYVEITTYDPS